jgi:23S rRNA U2552 (ribose-2'-O)-methylase RlmE/FtsJ
VKSASPKFLLKIPLLQAGCILSDMLQNVSGQHDVDHCRSVELSLTALEFCVHSLKPGGTFLCKFLRGRDDKELVSETEKHFGDVRLVKPKASRSESSEIYLLARKKTQG